MPAETKTADKPELAPVAEAPAEPAKPELQPGYVWCRILPRGHNKISTGETNRNAAGGYSDLGEGIAVFPSFPKGAIMQLPLKIAQMQEDNGYLEIQEG